MTFFIMNCTSYLVSIINYVLLITYSIGYATRTLQWRCAKVLTSTSLAQPGSPAFGLPTCMYIYARRCYWHLSTPGYWYNIASWLIEAGLVSRTEFKFSSNFVIYIYIPNGTIPYHARTTLSASYEYITHKLCGYLVRYICRYVCCMDPDVDVTPTL